MPEKFGDFIKNLHNKIDRKKQKTVEDTTEPVAVGASEQILSSEESTQQRENKKTQIRAEIEAKLANAVANTNVGRRQRVDAVMKELNVPNDMIADMEPLVKILFNNEDLKESIRKAPVKPEGNPDNQRIMDNQEKYTTLVGELIKKYKQKDIDYWDEKDKAKRA